MLCALGAVACAKGTPIEEGDVVIFTLRADAGDSPDASAPSDDESSGKIPDNSGPGDAGDTASPPPDPPLAPASGADGGAADAAPSDGGP